MNYYDDHLFLRLQYEYEYEFEYPYEYPYEYSYRTVVIDFSTSAGTSRSSYSCWFSTVRYSHERNLRTTFSSVGLGGVMHGLSFIGKQGY